MRRARSFSSLLALFLVLFTITSLNVSAEDPIAKNHCSLAKSSKHEQELYQVLTKFAGLELTIDDDHHTYYLTICQKNKFGKDEHDSFVQINKETNNTIVIGRISDVDLEGTKNFMRLNLKNGDKYANACKKSERSAVIYFECAKKEDGEKFKMIEENNDRDEDCNYVFVINAFAMCTDSPDEAIADKNITIATTTTTSPTTTTASTVTTTTTTTASAANTTTTTTAANATTSATSNGTTSDKSPQTTKPTDDNKDKKKSLGLFSVIFIIAISFGLVYMVMGTIYLRFVKRARGWEQIPNWPLWQAIGNKSADCCNTICRCGQRQSEVHSYENINDRESDDENLLNM